MKIGIGAGRRVLKPNRTSETLSLISKSRRVKIGTRFSSTQADPLLTFEGASELDKHLGIRYDGLLSMIDDFLAISEYINDRVTDENILLFIHDDACVVRSHSTPSGESRRRPIYQLSNPLMSQISLLFEAVGLSQESVSFSKID